MFAAQSSAVVGSPDWLVGYWIPEGESCESDAGVIYEPNGTWSAYGASGRWTLSNGAIISDVTERLEDGDEVKKLSTPQKHIEKIEALGPDKYVSRWEDGTVVRLSRCPGTSE
jgi:hypothetical protein